MVRVAPYSTPMYYLMHAGYEYRGNEDRDPAGRCYPVMAGKVGPEFGSWTLDRNRPDWQEAMVRDFAELGMTQTHLNVYPVGGELKVSTEYARALRDYVRLSEKYGLRVGVRLDALDETVLWSVHPENPESRRAEYLKWVREVAALLKGRTVYYILGDELTLRAETSTRPARAWTAGMYLDYFREVRAAIASADPAAKVGMFAASSGEWFNVLELLKHGYAEVGDAVAINHYNWRELSRFIADRDRLAPGKMLLTSGVGYISAGTASPRYPEGDSYSRYPTEQAHAAEIARTMYAWWEGGADNAPYYISLRNWVRDGRIYPRWFGFFGFEDYDISSDKFNIRRYPGWYAFQAVALTFYNRSDFVPPKFAIRSDLKLERMDAFEHHTTATGAGHGELVMMLWNDKPVRVRIELNSTRYAVPVRVPLDGHENWRDVEWGVDSGRTWIALDVGSEPVIVRLFKRREPGGRRWPSGRTSPISSATR